MVSRLRYFEKKTDKKPVSLKKTMNKKEKEEKMKQKKFFDIIKKRQRVVKKKDEKLSYAEQLAKEEVLKRKDEERKKEFQRTFVKLENPLVKLEAQLRELEFEKEKLIKLKKDRRSKEFKELSDKIKSKEKEIEEFKFTLTPEFKLKQEKEEKIELEQKALSQLRRQIKQALESNAYFNSKSDKSQKDIIAHYDKIDNKDNLIYLIKTLPKANIVYKKYPKLDSSLTTKIGLKTISDAFDKIMKAQKKEEAEAKEEEKQEKEAELEELQRSRQTQEKIADYYSKIINSPYYKYKIYKTKTEGTKKEIEDMEKKIKQLPYLKLKQLRKVYNDLIAEQKAEQKAEAEAKEEAKTRLKEREETRQEETERLKLYSEIIKSPTFLEAVKTLRKTGTPEQVKEINETMKRLPSLPLKELKELYKNVLEEETRKESLKEIKLDTVPFEESAQPAQQEKSKAKKKEEKILVTDEDLAEILKYDDMLKKKNSKKIKIDRLKYIASQYNIQFINDKKKLIKRLKVLIPKVEEEEEDLEMPKLIPAGSAEIAQAEAEAQAEAQAPAVGASGLNLQKMIKKHKKILSTISQDPKTHAVILGMASVHNKKHPKSMHMTIKYIIKQMKKGKVKGGKLHFKI